MWTPKWFRKQPNPPAEYATHILRYELGHIDDGTKVALTVHLPSRRVSESYYDIEGRLKQYVHSSSIADQHIKYIREHSNNLSHYIKESELIETNRVPQRKSRHKLAKFIDWATIVSCIVWLIWCAFRFFN